MKKLFGFDIKYGSDCPITTYKDLFKRFCISDIAGKLQRYVYPLGYAYFSIDYSTMFNDYVLYFIAPSNHNYCFVILPEDAYSKNIAMGYNFGVDLDSLDSLFGDVTDDELDKKVDDTLKEIVPKNNDGREYCFWCGKKTKKIDSGMFSTYDYCEGCKK